MARLGPERLLADELVYTVEVFNDAQFGSDAVAALVSRLRQSSRCGTEHDVVASLAAPASVR